MTANGEGVLQQTVVTEYFYSKLLDTSFINPGKAKGADSSYWD